MELLFQAEILRRGKLCNLAYTGSNFQLLGEGGEYGTATAADVLGGKTIGTEEGIISGTMPNRGAVNQNLTAEGQEYTIPSGYHNGLGKIKAAITGLVASVIKAGTTVGGILGTFTSDATAVDGEVLSGRTYYRNGTKGTGVMPVQGQKIQYLSQQNEKFIIARGYHTGDGFVQASFGNLSAENIKNGVNIGGVVGTLKPAILTGDIPTIAASDANIAHLLRNYSERKWAWSDYETLVKLKVKFTGSFRASMKASRDSSYSGRDVTVNHVVNGVSVATTTNSVSSGSSWTTVGGTVSIPVNEGDIYEFQAKIPNGFCDFYEFKAWGYLTEPIEILS